MTRAYVGLGSNLGDRLANLSAALGMLSSAAGARIVAASRAYESEPWGVTDQPPFANAVAVIDWEGDASSLLALCKDIESRVGRVAAERFGPRVIDLDVLLFGSQTISDEGLEVPHPRLLERDFVVTPLLEIAPDVRLPDGTAPSREGATAGRVTSVLGDVARPDGR